MIRFDIEYDNDYKGVITSINTKKYEKVDQKLKDVFIRHFNERDYKRKKLDAFKKSLENNNFQIITDYDFDNNKNINSKSDKFGFLIFDYNKLIPLIESLEINTNKKFEDIIDNNSIILISVDIENVFDMIYKLGANIFNITFTPYELFNKKITAIINFSFGDESNITRKLLSVLEIYNYIYNRAYELVKILSEKIPSSKIFDAIDSEEYPEAIELKTLLGTFNFY